jgi:hypothetical protein
MPPEENGPEQFDSNVSQLSCSMLECEIAASREM